MKNGRLQAAVRSLRIVVAAMAGAALAVCIVGAAAIA